MHFPTDQEHLLLAHGGHRKYRKFYALQRLESVIKCAREIKKCIYTCSRALSIDEIYEINQGRPWSSVPYPYINIVQRQPIESEDIYAEQNRTPRRIGLEGLTPQIQNRRQSCPEELLTVPLTKGEKTILRKHGLGYQHKRARKSFNISTRSRMIQDMRDKLHEQKLKNGQTIKKLSERC